MVSRVRARRRRPPRVWPNFFIGVRVRSARVVAGVKRLQAAIRADLPDLAPCLVDPRTLHVTLCVVHLADDRAVETASEVLRFETTKFLEQNKESELALDFSRWGFFGHRDVLFASTDVDARSTELLGTLAQALHGAFDRLGFTTGRFELPYTPHATVWKVSKARLLVASLNESRPPDSLVQDELARLVEGLEPPSGVEMPTWISLLNMRERDQDGYYREYAGESLISCS